jgi:hypothetical protein
MLGAATPVRSVDCSRAERPSGDRRFLPVPAEEGKEKGRT